MSALDRWSPLSGIVFVALFLGGANAYDNTPSIDDSDEEIVAYYTTNSNQLKLQIATLALTLGAVFFVWFVGVLAARVRAAEPGASWPSRTVLVSGAAFATLMIVGFLIQGMVADIGDDTSAFVVDPNTTRLLTDASYTFVFETALPLVAPLVFASSLALGGEILPRWLGWAGFVVAALCLVGFLGIPMGLFLIWIVVVAVYLIRRPATTAA